MSFNSIKFHQCDVPQHRIAVFQVLFQSVPTEHLSSMESTKRAQLRKKNQVLQICCYAPHGTQYFILQYPKYIHEEIRQNNDVTIRIKIMQIRDH